MLYERYVLLVASQSCGGIIRNFSVAQRMRWDYDEEFFLRGAWTLLMRWCKFSSACHSSQQKRRWLRAILHSGTPHFVHLTDTLMLPRLCELFTLYNPHRVRFLSSPRTCGETTVRNKRPRGLLNHFNFCFWSPRASSIRVSRSCLESWVW